MACWLKQSGAFVVEKVLYLLRKSIVFRRSLVLFEEVFCVSVRSLVFLKEVLCFSKKSYVSQRSLVFLSINVAFRLHRLRLSASFNFCLPSKGNSTMQIQNKQRAGATPQQHGKTNTSRSFTTAARQIERQAGASPHQHWKTTSKHKLHHSNTGH